MKATVLSILAMLGLAACTAEGTIDSRQGSLKKSPTCGNGVLDPDEQCDDGNRRSGDGCSKTCQFEVGLVSLTVSPPSASVPAGFTQVFAAVGIFSDGSTRDLTGEVIWTSSNGAVASVDANGDVTGVASGSATITATDPRTRIASSANLTVTSAALISLNVSPPSASVPAGFTQVFLAVGIFSDGSTHDLTGQVTWTSSNVAVASVDANGDVTGVALGSTTITATDPSTGIASSADLTVTSAALISLNVSPPSASVPAGFTQVFLAVGIFSDGSTHDLTGQVIWTSSNAAVASVDPNGNASGVAVGSSTITATDPGTGITSSADLTVTAPALISLTVSPLSASVRAGFTQVFLTVGIFSDGSTHDLTGQVTWTSSNVAVASVDPNGNASGVAVGSSTITATDPGTGITSSADLTVTAPALISLTVSPPSASVSAGFTQAFLAVGIFSDGSTHDLTGQVTWTSSNVAVASVDANGGASGVAVGSSTITATDPGTGITSSADLTVTAPALISLTVSPPSASVSAGFTQAFLAVGIFSDGSTHDLTGQVIWTSSNGAVASVDANGGASGVAVGSATITATDPSTGIASSANLTVTSAALISLNVSPPSASVPAGFTQVFVAVGSFSDGSTQDLTGQVAWTSSNGAVASVDANGDVTGVAVGSATITATDPSTGIASSADLTVTQAALISLNVSPPSASVPEGFTQVFLAVGIFSDGSTQDLTGPVIWTSSNAAVASIDPNGDAFGVAVGSATITATDPSTGIASSADLTVTAPN